MAWTYQLSADEVSGIGKALDPRKGAFYEDGILTVVDAAENAVVEAALPGIGAAALLAAKDATKAEVDAAAESVRLSYITAGAGQALTYSQKATEAVAYLGAANPVAADYPLLNAEVGITGPTIAEVAAIVKAAFDQWQIIGAQIEAARLGAKKAIAAAATAAEAQAVLDGIVWP
ncbi:MAG: hypothetical protein WC048_16735 [Rhizobium sp.]